MKRILTLAAVLVLVFTLSACQLFARGGKETVLEYALAAADGADLEVLEQYPNLQYVDLRGSTCIEAVLDYAESHPHIQVRFSIPLGQQSYNQDVTEITLSGNDASFGDLMNNLKLLRRLNSVHFDKISITRAQLDDLKAAYPQINFTYSVILGSMAIDTATTEVNISEISPEDVDTALAALGHLPNLTKVDLINSEGKSNLSAADCTALMAAYPQIEFKYEIQLFGQTLKLDTTAVTYHDVRIGNEGLEQIQQALNAIPGCTYICFDNCGIDYGVLDQFRSANPDRTIVWRIYVGDYSILTDTEVILMHNIESDCDTEPLKYCTNVKYLDMTGCKNRDFSFLAGMPNLECAILSYTFLSDLSVLCNSNLIWLELINCTALRDVTPLSGQPNLKYLNLSATKVKDLSPLDAIPVERLKCAKSSLNDDELDRFSEKHPNCLVTKKGSAIGLGWRYEDAHQRVPFPYYSKLVEVFDYKN